MRIATSASRLDGPLDSSRVPSSIRQSARPGLSWRSGIVAASLATILLAGCGITTSTGSPSSGASGASVAGIVHGGQQPVAFATVTLYAIGTTGYAAGPGTVVTSTLSDANGNFTLTTPFNCADGSMAYILAKGGNSGSGTNTAIGLAAFLGGCTTINGFIDITEVTTVAAAYTLAPFASIFSNSSSSPIVVNIGTSSTNTLGLANAFGANSNLININNGNARGVNEIPGLVLPTVEMNTLADILASCVNTNGSVTAGTTCNALFSAARPNDGLAPIDTFQAAIDIAQNPGNNVAALYALSSANGPFQPTIPTTSAPGDFALAIQYNGGQIANSGFTSGMAIDSKGDAWVGNAVGVNPKSISEISPNGTYFSGSQGFANSIAGGNGFSIDKFDNVFVAVAGLNEILKMNSSGNVISNLTPASLIKPTGLAVDNRDGSFWTADSNNNPSLNGGNSDFTGTTVTHGTSVGVDSPGSPFGNGNGPFGVQIDGLGNAWVADSAANNTSGSSLGFLAKYSPPVTAGGPYTAQTFQTGAGSYPVEIAFDANNNVYTTLINSVAKFTNAGVLNNTLTAASTIFPSSVMLDGFGRVFVSNGTNANFTTPGSLTVFDANGVLLSTANGRQGYLANNTIPGEPYVPTGLAIDASGNVWISGIANASTQFVTEIIGIAAPISTPTTVQSLNNTYGTRP